MKKIIYLLIIPIVLIVISVTFFSCDDAGIVTKPVTPGKYNRTYRGGPAEIMTTVIPLNDDGVLYGGYTSSSGAGANDFYVTRLTNLGDVSWSKTYGLQGNDICTSAYETTEGGFILAGNTTSTGANGSDILLVKTDPNGNLTWSTDFSLPGDQYACSVIQEANLGYTVCGISNENPGSNNDIIVLRVASNGHFVSENLFGGMSNDIAYKMIKTSDGGYLIAGTTYSFGAGVGDMYMLKLNSDLTISWSNRYGADGFGQVNDVLETTSHDIMVVGYTKSFGLSTGSMILFKTDHNGFVYNSEGWPRTLGDNIGLAEATSIVQQTDGSYFVTGFTTNSAGNTFLSVSHYFNNSVFDYSHSFGTTNDNYLGIAVLSFYGNTIVVGGNRSYGGPGNGDFFEMGLPDSSGKYVACLDDNALNLTGGSPSAMVTTPAATQTFPPAAETDVFPTLIVNSASTIKSFICGQ